MPKNCPIGKIDSHACWECVNNFFGVCNYKNTYIDNISEEKITHQINNLECLNCIHFQVCSRHMGGMDLMKCEDYKEELHAEWIPIDVYYSPMNRYVIQGYRCSNCKTKFDNYSNYCPHCGAIMSIKGEDK